MPRASAAPQRREVSANAGADPPLLHALLARAQLHHNVVFCFWCHALWAMGLMIAAVNLAGAGGAFERKRRPTDYGDTLNLLS